MCNLTWRKQVHRWLLAFNAGPEFGCSPGDLLHAVLIDIHHLVGDVLLWDSTPVSCMTSSKPQAVASAVWMQYLAWSSWSFARKGLHSEVSTLTPQWHYANQCHC